MNSIDDSSLSDVGLIGLAVMGQNLVLNMADHGNSVSVFNRTHQRAVEFASRATPDQRVIAPPTLADFVASIRRPRRVMVMVKAGEPVDSVIADLLPLLDRDDIVVDCGNSLYTDTERRHSELSAHGIRFIGAGVSGGEEGARHGPSIMPGGDVSAWPDVKGMLQSIAAKSGPEGDEPCCDWIGSGGAGHYVKMIHNGIEYGDMQVLAEATEMLRARGLEPAEISQVFEDWNQGRLQSYLVEITAKIMGTADDDGTPLIDVILDAAGQKGTGKWTVISAMELGQPLTLVSEAVAARMVSSFVETRAVASGLLRGPATDANLSVTIDDIADAAYAAKLISYAQGFMVLAAASKEHGWDLDLGAISRMWRGGCIIRAAFLDDIAAAYAADPALENLLFDGFFVDAICSAQDGLRRTVLAGMASGVALPAHASALAFYDGLRVARGSASLLQAQRDYFGAHTYERVDRPRGTWFHTDWNGTGSAATSGSYSA